MQIPEINQNQLNILKRAGENEETTTYWIIPDPVKDRPDEFFKFLRSQEDIEGLIKIQMLVDSTNDEENKEHIKAMEEANGRKFRAVSITNWGMALFGSIFQMASGVN